MLGLKMNYIIRNKISKRSWVYLVIILLLALCIIIYIKINTFVEEQNHEQWVKQKEQEFKPIIELVYSIMKGEKRVPENSLNPLSRYDISRYADYQDACRIEAKIEIIDVEEILEGKKYVLKVTYTHRLTDKNGETVGASIGIESDWTVEKGKDGTWEIVDIDELA